MVGKLAFIGFAFATCGDINYSYIGVNFRGSATPRGEKAARFAIRRADETAAHDKERARKENEKQPLVAGRNALHDLAPRIFKGCQ